MKIIVGLSIAIIGVACQGCSPIANGIRTLIVEPVHYCRRCVAWTEMQKNAELAEASWAEYCGAHVETVFSEDFAKGYKCGFADYLFAGGTGNPPPLPPRCYWGSKYESPEGHAMIQDWFAGFRQGSAAAMHSGLRQSVVVPASTALPIRSTTSFVGGNGAAADGILPSPKELPPGTAPADKQKKMSAPADPGKNEAAPPSPREAPSLPNATPAPPVSPMPSPGSATSRGEAGEPLSGPIVPVDSRNVLLGPPEPLWTPAVPADSRIVLPGPPEPLSDPAVPADARIVLPGPPESLSTLAVPADSPIVLPASPEPLSTSGSSADSRIVLPSPPKTN